MSLTPGTRLGVYEITALLGEGGMGQVFRATDTKLKRQVAIKILPPALAADGDRLARFQREAEVLASLNHPNIAAIYGLEESEGITALVMELVDGDDLSQRIAKSAVPVDEALPIAKQIAEALEAAHEQGIIHRDLKPANIKVRSDGTVKILDFGLAKAMEPAAGASPNISMSPTITTPAMTQAGMILGTAAYMSPEQARGKSVDKRTDIWAFGAVLFEMLTGHRAFDGHEVADVIVSVLSKEPDWAPILTEVRPLLQACLEKDPRKRLRDISDGWRLLQTPTVSTSAGASDRAHNPQRRAMAVVPWAVAGVLLAMLAGLGWMHFTERALEPTPVHFTLTPPDGTAFREPFAVSPDGKSVAFAAAGAGSQVRLWVRSLDTPEARPLLGTDNPNPNGLFWSPDGRLLAFVSDGALKRVEVAGGTVQTICPLPDSASFRDGAWAADGTIVFGISQVGLMRVAASGGTPTLLTSAPNGNDSSPSLLPDGRHFLYTRTAAGTGMLKVTDIGVYIGALDVVPERQLTSVLLPASALGVAYVPGQAVSSGYLLFERDRTLMAQPFDWKSLELKGEAAVIGSDLVSGTMLGLARSSFTRAFSASAGGTLVYRSGGSAEVSQLRWVDRHGAQVGQVGPAALYGNVVLSADGKTVVVGRTDDASVGNRAWVVDLARGVFSRLNTLGGVETPQAISPDGRVAFTWSADGVARDMYLKRMGGVDPPELLATSDTVKHPNDWSRDGRFLIYDEHHPTRRQDLWVIPVTGDRKPVPFLVTPADETFGQFSPDGRWVAYSSDESGRREIYVRGFAPDRSPAAAVGQWQISPEGGDKPRWSADGKELFYIARDGKMTAVPVKSGETFEPGVPMPLFDTRVTGFTAYAVAPDGRFLINTVPETTSASSITIVLNWQARLRK